MKQERLAPVPPALSLLADGVKRSSRFRQSDPTMPTYHLRTRERRVYCLLDGNRDIATIAALLHLREVDVAGCIVSLLVLHQCIEPVQRGNS